MAVSSVALIALAAGVTGLLVRRWWLAVAALAGVALASALDGHAPRSALLDGLDAMALVAGMVFVAAAASRSGLLAASAHRLTDRLPRARWLLVVTFLLAVVLTTVANLDTTAVLFTPVALEVGSAAALPLAPFALAAILGANFGSMLLPTSNLTNLVVWRHTDLSFAAFAAEHAVIAVGAVALTLGALVLGSRFPASVRPGVSSSSSPSSLAPRQAAPAMTTAVLTDEEGPRPLARPRTVTDVTMAWMSAATIVLLVVAFFAGLPVGPVTLAGGLVLVAVRPQLWSSRIDLRLVLAALAVFGASGVLATSLDTAGRLGHVSPLGLAVLGGLLASVGTNLAATLTLVPAASTATLRSALLIGVNLGVGFTPVASLATVLWRDSLAARGVPTPWRRYFAVAVPLSLVFLASSVLL
jgi:arsenical pump membrane protein